ncbi:MULTISPECIES: bifunctional folylpolyglutamate synthase/dihydrofolate synthase [Aerococcus]|nr:MULTISPECIES: folylpolyglutamate synthase/dihydrofolate synthase family protein [Aerococcus]KAA9234510.1 bifunctional folylpolyglutamate synthase/dihydrofolate synthase [Aerococcus mictus]MDK6374401.1 folylpolyglutamate synthase/dihydrofolate synthase family protein [Aerococcus urinae]MDK6420987.1 folylpolyglutamate synthase/dihydrofolate synthase family protein [Aerococcus urinae]MDK8075037.1 folylpolyglutamate synthase/dihydrofolate synthase family protein [Aerococcus urinae]MDK8085006.1 
MDYEEFEKDLPVLERGKWTLGLDHIRDLMAVFDNPQDKLPTVHIAGTNGKGSTASMIARTLQLAGYKVGLYTSPSLVSFNERIRINGENIADEKLRAMKDYMKEKLAGTKIQCSEFELFTAMAWLIFYHEGCDIIVLEVGLGGRLDATNLVKSPLVSVITKIALDHENILGHTISEIAKEKAGIIKYYTPVVVYPYPKEAIEVLSETAERQGAPLKTIDTESIENIHPDNRQQVFTYKGEDYQLNLLGKHQVLNACLAIEALAEIKRAGFNVELKQIKEGLQTVSWPGRFEWVHQDPEIIIDGSHNLDGVRAMRHAVEDYFPNIPRLAITGMLKDKDVYRMLGEVVHLFDEIVTITPDSDRAMTANELTKAAHMVTGLQKVKTYTAKNNEDAMAYARRWADQQEGDCLICVFGSLYLVGELRELVFESFEADQ